MKSYNAQFITRTAILLALCVAVQQFKTLSQFITGPLVNAILIIAALAVGLWSGVCIAVLSPIMAALISPAPIMKLMPQLIPMIMLGNILIVVFAWALRNKKIWVGLVLGSLAKAGFLALALAVVVLPFFGGGLNDAQRTAVTAMFSYNQLITALIGSALCLLIWPRLRKAPGFVLKR